jgi:F-type H+-transporting ATPase subunit a
MTAIRTWFTGLTRGKQTAVVGGGLLLLFILLFVIFGSAGRNNEFQPQNEFKVTPWVEIKIGGLDLSITKAVFYVILAATLSTFTMVYIAKRMQDKPNNVQTAIEAAYDLTYNQIARNNMDQKTTLKWFPFIATMFFFIWFSNMVGYIPLPTNTEESVNVLGLHIPAFAIYAATANLSIPLILSTIVWLSYHIEGVRDKGLFGYLKSWIPSGVSGVASVPIFFIEVISHFVRLISLSVRLFANLLAGHLLILFMGGGLVVILGVAALGVLTLPVAVVFFIFEVILIATLQAFIFSTLTAIYLGEATSAEGH